jgi:hypothetical protein
MKIGDCTLQNISNVRKCAHQEDVYFCDIEISFAEGFPFEKVLYCARSDDFAPTGKWVYQQIISGGFEGEITQLLPNTDPATGLPYPVPTKSTEISTDIL